MPQDNGRIYIETENGVKKGVSLDDIGSAIGSGSRDLGTLCTHENINIWAKYKPIQVLASSFHGVVSEEMRAAVNYGLNIPNVITMAQALAYYDIDESGLYRMNGWTYETPTVYRALDFIDGNSFIDGYETVVGYDHDAVPPISSIGGARVASNQSTNAKMTFSINFAYQSQNGLSVKLEDMNGAASIMNYYFAVVVKPLGSASTTSDYIIASTTSPLIDAVETEVSGDILKGLQIDVWVNNVTKGMYEVYPLLCNSPVTILSQDETIYQVGSGNFSSVNTHTTSRADHSNFPSAFYTIPCAYKLSVEIIDSSIEASFKAVKVRGSNNKIEYTLTVTNKGTSSADIAKGDFFLCYKERTSLTAALSGAERSAEYEAFTIAAGATVVKTYTFTVNTSTTDGQTIYATGKAWYRFGSNDKGPFNIDVQPIKPPIEILPDNPNWHLL